MVREVGGGIGIGKTCEPKAFSFQCMTKFTTNKKKKGKKMFDQGALYFHYSLGPTNYMTGAGCW